MNNTSRLIDAAIDNLGWGDLARLEQSLAPVMTERMYWWLVDLNLHRLWYSLDDGVTLFSGKP
jgi:hypothetical protein